MDDEVLQEDWIQVLITMHHKIAESDHPLDYHGQLGIEPAVAAQQVE
jgi:hypothetical protein